MQRFKTPGSAQKFFPATPQFTTSLTFNATHLYRDKHLDALFTIEREINCLSPAKRAGPRVKREALLWAPLVAAFEA
jgi:hypothetical protein